MLADAAAAKVPVIQGGQDGYGGVLGAGVVAVFVALAHGRGVGFAGDLHIAAGGHCHQVVALIVGPGAGVAEGSNRRHNEAGVVGPQGVVLESPVGKKAAVAAGDDNVGVGGQAAKQGLARFGFQVEGDGALVGVVKHKIQAAPGVGQVAGIRPQAARGIA